MMFEHYEGGQDDRGPSARHLVLVFLACVAVCAVFFSLGFLIGYNQRASKSTPTSENVTAPSEIPPAVNPPQESTAATSETSAAPSASSSASAPPAETPTPLATPPARIEKPAKARKREAENRARPEAPPVQAAESETTPAGHPGAGYSVQVMAARTRADADSLTSVLKNRGYPAFVLTPQAIGATDHLYRVLVGPYTSRALAQNIRGKLEKEGFKPFIKH